MATNLTEAQDCVKRFNDARLWLGEKSDIKDLLLNITEETGEAWNLIKWVSLAKQHAMFAEQHDEWEDFVGDQLFLIFKIAAMTGVDAEKGFKRTMQDYEDRFPIEKVKGTHTNLYAGGHDGKYVTDDSKNELKNQNSNKTGE